MRFLLLIGVVAFAAFTAGWFNINREGDSTTIEINRAEIRSDARRAIDKGRDILDKREAELASRQDSGDQRFDDGLYTKASGYSQQTSGDDRYVDQRYRDDSRYVDPYQSQRYSADRYDSGQYRDNQYDDDRYARPSESDRYQYNARR